MNEDTRSKLSEMVTSGLINNESFLSFFRRPSNFSLKELMKSQYEFTHEKITKFKLNLFDSWKTDNTVWSSDEICVLVQLIQNSGVLTRKELIQKTRLAPYRITRAIDGLEEEKYIDRIVQHQNEQLIFLSATKFEDMAK